LREKGHFLGILRSFLTQTCPAEGVEGMTKPEQLRMFFMEVGDDAKHHRQVEVSFPRLASG
jgi:hypothetical protein